MGTWCRVGIWLLRSGVTGISCPSYYNKIIIVLLLWQNGWPLSSPKIKVALLDCQEHMGLVFTPLRSFTESFNQLPSTSIVSLTLTIMRSRAGQELTCPIFTMSRTSSNRHYMSKDWRPLKTKKNVEIWLWWLQISGLRSSVLLNARIGRLHMAQDSLKLHLEMIIFCPFYIVNNILLGNFLLTIFLWVFELVIKIIFICFPRNMAKTDTGNLTIFLLPLGICFKSQHTWVLWLHLWASHLADTFWNHLHAKEFLFL